MSTNHQIFHVIHIKYTYVTRSADDNRHRLARTPPTTHGRTRLLLPKGSRAAQCPCFLYKGAPDKHGAAADTWDTL